MPVRVAGAYVLRVTPAAACRAPRTTFSFDVRAMPVEVSRPAVQIVLDGASRDDVEASILEMEMLVTRTHLLGSVATMHWNEPGKGGGARSREGVHVWIQGIATGELRRGTVREVMAGTLVADLSFGRHEADRDGLGAGCVGLTHAWSLRVR